VETQVIIARNLEYPSVAEMNDLRKIGGSWPNIKWLTIFAETQLKKDHQLIIANSQLITDY
jgi:hypothetical protein